MTKEEKQAIDTLQNCIADYVIGDFCCGKYCPDEDMCKNDDCPYEKAIDIVVNLIEKQQEEIDQYKELDKKICNEELLDKNYVLENYISKDKIKSKIKELEEKDKDSINNVYGYGIYFLKELLEGE